MLGDYRERERQADLQHARDLVLIGMADMLNTMANIMFDRDPYLCIKHNICGKQGTLAERAENFEKLVRRK